MLFRRHLVVSGELATKFDWRVSVDFARSERNRAEILDRINKRCLQESVDLEDGVDAMCRLRGFELKRLNDVTRQSVQKLVGMGDK